MLKFELRTFQQIFLIKTIEMCLPSRKAMTLR